MLVAVGQYLGDLGGVLWGEDQLRFAVLGLEPRDVEWLQLMGIGDDVVGLQESLEIVDILGGEGFEGQSLSGGG